MSKKERQAYRRGIIDAVLYGTMLITGILMTSVYFYTKLFIQKGVKRMFIFGMLLGAIIGMYIIALMSVDTINEAESLARASRKS